MILSNHEEYFKIQKYLAIIIFVASVVGMVANFFDTKIAAETKVLNIITIGLIIFPISIITYLLNNVICRICQTALFFIVSILVLLFGDNEVYFYLAESLFMVGILLLYFYNFIKTHRYWHTILYFGILFCYRLYKAFELNPTISAPFVANYLVEALLSTLLIVFIITISQRKVVENIKKSQENELLRRMGLNASTLIHHLKLESEIDWAKFALEDLHKKDYKSLESDMQYLVNLLNSKHILCQNILNGITRKKHYREKIIDINIHNVLDSIIEILLLNQEVYEKIFIQKEYDVCDIFVRGIYEEIYLVFQNIIINSIDSMLKIKKTGHRLVIDTSCAVADGYISISDSGTGFNQSSIHDRKVNLSSIHSTKENGGLGMLYILDTLKRYNGKIEYQNKKDGGAEGIIKLPYYIK